MRSMRSSSTHPSVEAASGSSAPVVEEAIAEAAPGGRECHKHTIDTR